jgi:hypothetical protein
MRMHPRRRIHQDALKNKHLFKSRNAAKNVLSGNDSVISIRYLFAN